jgi:cathepsin C
MIYDEGFEVVINGYSFFAFNKYKPKPQTSLTSQEVSDYVSFCSETMTGWYHDVPQNRHWGCWRGYQVINGDATNSLRMEEKSVTLRHHHIVSPIKRHHDHKIFEPDYAFVEMINSDSNSMWRAKVHGEFLGKRHGEMMRLLGRKNFIKGGRPEDGPGGLHKLSLGLGKHEAPDGLPLEFSWTNVDGVNYDSPVRNQGDCGSCYAVAAIQMFESRLYIKLKQASKGNRVRFSPQEVVACSRYNQGCDGGYPFLVGKHGEEFGFVTEACDPYSGHGSCSSVCSSAKRYYVANHTYVGGYYGACNEAAMMREIYRAGPVVVAFQAPSSLFYYTGGVFTGPPPKSEGHREKGVNAWEQTNHAVVAVGWGIEPSTNTKYWLIKNTWGPSWGESGYFRIRRGTDECGIESMASSFDVVV